MIKKSQFFRIQLLGEKSQHEQQVRDSTFSLSKGTLSKHMGNNKQILATSTTVNCIPPNKMQRLASNCYTFPEGPECDAQQKSEQTVALPSIHLTFFPLFDSVILWLSACQSVYIPAVCAGLKYFSHYTVWQKHDESQQGSFVISLDDEFLIYMFWRRNDAEWES